MIRVAQSNNIEENGGRKLSICEHEELWRWTTTKEDDHEGEEMEWVANGYSEKKCDLVFKVFSVPIREYQGSWEMMITREPTKNQTKLIIFLGKRFKLMSTNNKINGLVFIRFSLLSIWFSTFRLPIYQNWTFLFCFFLTFF